MRCNRTCSLRAEGELLAELGGAVLVEAGDPRPVVRPRPKVREDVHAAVEVLALTSRSDPGKNFILHQPLSNHVRFLKLTDKN